MEDYSNCRMWADRKATNKKQWFANNIVALLINIDLISHFHFATNYFYLKKN